MSSPSIRSVIDRLMSKIRGNSVIYLGGLELWADDDGEFRVHLISRETSGYAFAHLEDLEPSEAVDVVIEAGRVSGPGYEGVELKDLTVEGDKDVDANPLEQLYERSFRPEAIEVEWLDDDISRSVKLPDVEAVTPEEARALANNLDQVLLEHVTITGADDE